MVLRPLQPGAPGADCSTDAADGKRPLQPPDRVKDHEGYVSTLAGFRIIVFVCLMLERTAEMIASS